MRWIDNVINGLIDLYGTTDPHELCDALEIKVCLVESGNILLKGNFSIYLRDYMDNEIIFIDQDLNRNYLKFYLLHELGHAILHTEFNNSFINDLQVEKQANYFALKLINVEFDQHELEGMTIQQVSNIIQLPAKVLKQIMSQEG